MTDIFDFGFTAVDEDELDTVVELQDKAELTLSYQTRLENLYNAIQPLLTNLKANPEKEYIKWSNRLEKVEAFEDHIQAIYMGQK